MQDDWVEILGDITNNLASFEKLEQKITPKLLEIQNNADDVDPELMKIYNEEMSKLNLLRADLQKAKDKIRSSKI